MKRVAKGIEINEKFLQRCLDTLNVGRDSGFYWGLKNIASAEKIGDMVWLKFGVAWYCFNDKGEVLLNERKEEVK